MRIVIAGGRDEADFLIAILRKKKHKLTIINADRAYCDLLAGRHGIPIVYGDPTKQFVLEEAHIRDADVIIALTDTDADNLTICQYGKLVFGVKKAICTVANPKNVEIFQQLGVKTALSATYMVAQYIEQATSIENLIKTFPIQEDKVLLHEIIVESGFPCVDKKLKDIAFPKNAIIGCILRRSGMIVPNGESVIHDGDKLLVLTSPQNQKRALEAITGT